MWWKLLVDLELWWINLQLGEFQISGSLVIAFLLLSTACVVIAYLALKAAIWRDRAERANQLFRMATVIFPAPSVWPGAIIASLVAASGVILWYLW